MKIKTLASFLLLMPLTLCCAENKDHDFVEETLAMHNDVGEEVQYIGTFKQNSTSRSLIFYSPQSKSVFQLDMCEKSSNGVQDSRAGVEGEIVFTATSHTTPYLSFHFFDSPRSQFIQLILHKQPTGYYDPKLTVMP